MPDPRSIYFEPEWDHTRAARGSDVPSVVGEELVQAMRENVAGAMRMRDKAMSVVARLQADRKIITDEREGRLRPVRVQGPGGKMVPDPVADVALSDWYRATAELAHWNEYLEWAKTQRAPTPDSRLPPEDDQGIPF